MSTSEKEKLLLEWRKCRSPTKRAELRKKIRNLASNSDIKLPTETIKPIEKMLKKSSKVKVESVQEEDIVKQEE